MTIQIVFLVLALVSFIAGAAEASVPRVNLVALGLAFYILSMLVH